MSFIEGLGMNKFVFVPGNSKVNSSSDSLANWMANCARNGIFDVFHIPLDLSALSAGQVTSAGEQLQGFVEGASEFSRYLDGPYVKSSSNDFRILDTALSDAGFVFNSMLRRVSQDNRRVSIRVLLANPHSEFARARNEALDTDPIVRLTQGLTQICHALQARDLCGNPDRIVGSNLLSGPEKISRLMELINNSCQSSNNVTCEIKLYNGPLYGPSYFFQNILLQGKYSPAKSGSANVMPWLVVVNNPNVSNDMYDMWDYEFETLWNDTSKTLSTFDSSMVEADVFVIHNLDSRFKEKFNVSLRRSFASELKTHYASASDNQRIKNFGSLNNSIKLSKVIIFILTGDDELVPFEVLAGMLNHKHIAVIRNEQSNSRLLPLLRNGTDRINFHSFRELNNLFRELAHLLGLTEDNIDVSPLDIYFRDEI